MLPRDTYTLEVMFCQVQKEGLSLAHDMSASLAREMSADWRGLESLDSRTEVPAGRSAAGCRFHWGGGKAGVGQDVDFR
jgi:hypothetical protein